MGSGIHAFGDALKTNTTLAVLDFTSVYGDSDGLCDLLKGAQTNTTLKNLILANNPALRQCYDTLVEFISTNTTLQTLVITSVYSIHLDNP